MLVYEPAEDSYLLQKYVRKHALGRVLDVGTGSGIQAFTALKVKRVKEVVGVDINEKAIQKLLQEVKERKLKKIKFLVSNLLEKVKGKFDTIIFNPPYLPQDKGIVDESIYGGKKGWELIEKFFQEVSLYLSASGKILLLCSSLTNPKKVEEIMRQSLFEFELLERKPLPFFEELSVYLAGKSKVLKELERKRVSNIHYFAHGKRGEVFTGILSRKGKAETKNKIKIAIKIKRKKSEAKERMSKEVKWLKKLNKKGIGPRLLFFGKDYLVYEFVEGEFILEWIKKRSEKEIKKVLLNILMQCFALDQMRMNKEEMHRPVKHILVNSGGIPVLIDFERGKETDKPQNVTQLVEFICRIKEELNQKRIKIEILKLRKLAEEYKKEKTKRSWRTILKEIAT